MADPKHASKPYQIALHLAGRSRPLSASQLADELGMAGVSRNTLLSWLRAARHEGWVLTHGDRRWATWTASEELRRDVLRQQLALPLEKRPRVSYQEEFLAEYIPNETFYLPKASRERLHLQCTPGSAAFHSLNAHDQSLFLCGLSFASSSFEGNPYDLAATEDLLKDGLEKEGASPTETTMVINHHEAVRYLVGNTHFPPLKSDCRISAQDIKSLHSLLSSYLLRDPAMCGRLRQSPVRINGSSYIPLALPSAIELAFVQIIDKANQIRDPYEQSFFLLMHLPYLQPFENCNKRTARVACNIPLLRAGVVPMSWMDVSHQDFTEALLGVYERCNTSLFAEIFTDGYINSSVRFNIMQQSVTPNEILVKYRSELRPIIRGVVLDGESQLQPEVPPADLEAFGVLVQVHLALVRSRDMATLLRMGLQEGDVDAWQAREGQGGATSDGQPEDWQETVRSDQLMPLRIREMG
jgi:hypothetical protein